MDDRQRVVDENGFTINPINHGEFYESCDYHPRVCIHFDDAEDELVGVSLIDGSIRSCSIVHCGVVKLTPKAAISSKLYGNREMFESEFQEGWGPDEWEDKKQWWKDPDFKWAREHYQETYGIDKLSEFTALDVLYTEAWDTMRDVLGKDTNQLLDFFEEENIKIFTHSKYFNLTF